MVIHRDNQGGETHRGRAMIERDLKAAHKLLCRATAHLVIQIVKRKFRRIEVQKALGLCREAETVLLRLVKGE